jgi:hydroxypyruvate isomerase
MGHEAQRDHVIETLRRLAPLAGEQRITLTIEVLNQLDNPGYYLGSSQEAIEIVRAVAHPNVRFQYDFYHMQLLEGNLINTLSQSSDYIGHVQVADPPGRHEPGTGEINFPRVLQALVATGYRGYVGLEYSPWAQGAAALAWVPQEARANLPA